MCIKQNCALEELINTQSCLQSCFFLQVHLVSHEKYQCYYSKASNKIGFGAILGSLLIFCGSYYYQKTISDLIPWFNNRFSWEASANNDGYTVLGHQTQQKQGLQSRSSPKTQEHDTQLKHICQKIKAFKNKSPDDSLDTLVYKDIEEDAFPMSSVPYVKNNDVL